MKKMKNITILFLVVPLTILLIGLITHRTHLNTYLSQKTKGGATLKTSSAIDTTEIHIVGTLHFETDSIKRDHLYNFIDSIAPMIILYEGTAGRVKRLEKRTDYLLQLWNAFKKGTKMERAVVLKYMKNHPTCLLLPYEWELRDQYHRKHKLRKKSKKLINLIIKLHRDSLLSRTQSESIDKFLTLNNTLVKMDRNATIADINTITMDSILRERQYYIYKIIPEIAKARKEASEYFDFIPAHMNYWDARNQAMVQNILKQVKAHPNKVIAVLNGYYHRYYLIDELKKYEAEHKFKIKQL